MLPRDELLESIDILVQNAKKETTQIYVGLVTAIADSGNTCTVKTNGKSHSGIIYYGDTPTVNKQYRVFAPNGSMNQAFIITGGSGGVTSLPIASATQLGGIKVGAGLAINSSGVLSATGGGTADSVDWANVQDKPTTIAGYGIVDAKISGNNIILGSNTMTPYSANNAPPYPVTSVNGKTGAVTIDVGGNVDSVNGKMGDVVLDASDVGALPDTTVIPTKNSQLTNDSGYITGAALTPYAKLADIPTKVSELDNDSGYITDSALEPYARTADVPTKTSQLTNDSGYVDATGAKNAAPVQSVDGATGDVVTNAVKTTVQSLTDAQKLQARTNIGAGTSSFDGDYNSLSNKPTIPTKVSQLENDSNYATESQVEAKYTKPTGGIPKSDLASDVQTSLDKANTALQSAPVTSVNSKTGNVVLSADDVGALPDTTVVPSKTSDLTNDSGFITEIPIASATQLGGVKIGSGIVIASDGTISATGGGGGSGAVDSVNGKVGDVVLTPDDIGAIPLPSTVTANTWLKTDADKNFVLASLPNASTGSRGITYLVNSYMRTDTDKAVTPKALNDVYNLIPTITQTLGTSTDKVPSEKAVSDALQSVEAGDMLKSVYDSSSEVESAGGISSFVADTITNKVGTGNITIILNGNKVDSFNVNTKEDKNIKIDIDASDVGLGNVIDEPQYCESNPPPYPVTSVNGKTGDVVIDVSGGGTQVKIVRW